MAFRLLSLPPEALLAAFQETVKPLFYPSETDAPIEVEIRTVAEVGEAFSKEDIARMYYPDGHPMQLESVEWLEANRLESNGTQYFFRDSPNVITTYPNNEFYVHESAHRDTAPQWRKLRDLFFDHLVQQRWFRANLMEPDQARADIYLVGRMLKIEVDDDTNETRIERQDWVVIKSYVIET